MKRQSSLLLFILTFFISTISSSFAHALSVKRLSLDQSVKLADRIFRGTVTDKRVVKDTEESGRLVAYYAFKVEECLKGACNQETLTTKQLIGWPAGMPEYQIGKHYLVLLSGESSVGLTAPIGMWQGQYDIQEVKGRLTVPALKDKQLNAEVQKQARIHALTLPALSEPSTSDDYESFKAVILKLVEGDK